MDNSGRTHEGEQRTSRALSKPALEILAALPRERDNPFIFIGSYKAGLSHTAMAGVLARMDRRDVTVHGMRSTFRTWAGERTRYHAHVIEMCSAHNIGSAVERAYARGDLFTKRARLMTEWGNYCTAKPIKGSVEAVPLRRQS